MTITVFLQRDVAGLGRAEQLVTVSQAYARNFLLPKGFAVIATPTVMARARQATTVAQALRGQTEAAVRSAAATLTGQTVRLSGRANPQGKLFAALKTDQVMAAIHDQYGLRLPSTTMLEPDHYKTIGAHSAQLKVGDQQIVFTIQLDHAKKE